ncbi:hypothetical protein MHO82_20955 [Vibrio sp. Of7-15]|uniref:hypothetical protein n=1 Tax=Vibrio sp. Of7-15 TaxID=2724879 RepID=UPI001EF2BF36|nr:hypothetical protein [Vibrio sp. Of7-15]MCG7499338.1 hypothetical protein [Vibrio sp. Of7-15]
MVFSITSCSLPENALLARYRQEGAYTDCFTTEIVKGVSHEQFVRAFYTTPIFKLERLILTWGLSKPSSDADVRQLAQSKTETFSAWQVERRSENQILMCDYLGKTRSWLMVEPYEDGQQTKTKLYFGSAVVSDKKKTQSRLGAKLNPLLWFHVFYSVILLSSAKRRLQAL